MLQHIACEPPGAFEDVLVKRSATIHHVELDEGEKLPDWRDVDAIVAMGGPMSVNDDDTLPWLSEEKRFISRSWLHTPRRCAPRLWEVRALAGHLYSNLSIMECCCMAPGLTLYSVLSTCYNGEGALLPQPNT